MYERYIRTTNTHMCKCAYICINICLCIFYIENLHQAYPKVRAKAKIALCLLDHIDK